MKKQQQWIYALLETADINVNGNRPWDIKIINPAIYNRVLTNGSLGLGESYMEGWWECDALDEFFYRLLQPGLEPDFRFSLLHIMSFLRSHVFNLQSTSRAFQVGKKHYDLGNDFFITMLGQSMAYSCGYWKDANNLDNAQFAKFDLICRKLQLQKGQRILEIGSGWGSFAKYAAMHYGVSVVGVTVSKEQQLFATDFCKGLPVEFRLEDYRNLNEGFDHIMSIGMFEHVGPKNYREYMKVARRCLKQNGLFLLHTIGYLQSGNQFDPWLEKYIFPNAVLPSLAQISASTQSLFVIEDIHNFGAYYDKTLMAWHKNFKEYWPEFKEQYGPTFYRMWEYYLLQCAALFRARQTQLWQMVLSPYGVKGGYNSIR